MQGLFRNEEKDPFMPSWIIQLQPPFFNYFLVASASQRSDRTRATVRYGSKAAMR